jgi:hypothetical protein
MEKMFARIGQSDQTRAIERSEASSVHFGKVGFGNQAQKWGCAEL